MSNLKKKAFIVTAVAGFIRGFLINDIKTLQRLGYEVHCGADANNVGADEIDSFFANLGVKFHQIGFNSKKPFSKQSLKSYFNLRKVLKEEKFDLIHCHTPIAGFITRFASITYRMSGTKVIYTSHGFYFHKGANKKTWLIYYPIEWLASAMCDAIITINFEDFNTAKGMLCKKCFHINGVGLNTERFLNVSIDRDEYRKSLGVEKGDIMLLAAGELSVRKNHQIILKALSILKNPRIKFILCGRAMQGKGTYDLLKRLGEEYNVNFSMLGFRGDMPQICHCADIGILPSTREGLGMVSLQMMAAGVPMVTSNVHGIVDYIVEGKNGFMYNPMDAKGFAEGINKLCDKELRLSMKQFCISTALKFSAEVSRQQMSDIYHEILKL